MANDIGAPHQATAELVGLLEQAKVTGALHLSHMGLSAVPSQVWALTDLTRLDLGHNDLTVLSPEVGRLTKLEGASTCWCCSGLGWGGPWGGVRERGGPCCLRSRPAC